MSSAQEVPKYVYERIGDPSVHLFCNECGYKWIIQLSQKNDSLEDFEDFNLHYHCPMCGSDDIEEQC